MRQESEYPKALTTAATYDPGPATGLRTAGDALVALFQASGG